MLGAAIGAVSSIVGGYQQNRNIDMQIAAQKDENQKNREYNLNLAQRQNQWNIDQWNRENSYNTPAAQMARYRAAGLNPDLMYGQQNLAAASPEMTAGEASQPTDMSAIGQKQTALTMASAALDNAIKVQQLKGLKEENKGKELDNVDKKYSNYFNKLRSDDEYFMRHYFTTGDIPDEQEFAERFGGMLSYHDIQMLNRLRTDVKKNKNEYESTSVDLAIKEIDRKFKEDSVQYLLDDLAEKLKITKEEAKNYAKMVSLRLKGMDLDNIAKENEQFWNSPGFLEKLPEGISALLRLLTAVRGLFR